MPQISVVLPVYNVEEYLRQCLDSLANQTFEDFEVICVNDGSDDSSLSILEEYAPEDERFKIISQENKGLSGARNTGMNYIKGKYTIFVDSDDWLELNALEELYNKITDLDSDILMYKFRFFNQDSEQYSESVFTNLEVIGASLENKNFNYRDVSDILFKISHAPFNKLYKTSFLREAGIKFPENLNYEDLYFFYMVFFKTEKVSVFRDEPLYNYRIRNNSISTTGNERSFDIFEILDLTQDNLKNVNIYSKVKDDFLMFVIVNLKYVYLRLNERLKNQYLQKMKEKYEFYSLNQVKKDHLNTWHFDDRVFYQAIVVSSNGIEFELNYKKLYYEFLANHYEGVIEQLRNENQVLAQKNNDLKKQLANSSIKNKFKKIVKL